MYSRTLWVIKVVRNESTIRHHTLRRVRPWHSASWLANLATL